MPSILSELKAQNEIEEEEFSEMTRLLYGSFVLKKPNKDKKILEKQSILISLFTEMLSKYLELKMVNDKKIKLEFINFIDKLNLQKELLDLQKGITSINDIKETAQRFGRKSQSAFSKK
jgi:hypothetical protein